jgi:hypothetical protein
LDGIDRRNGNEWESGEREAAAATGDGGEEEDNRMFITRGDQQEMGERRRVKI